MATHASWRGWQRRLCAHGTGHRRRHSATMLFGWSKRSILLFLTEALLAWLAFAGVLWWLIG